MKINSKVEKEDLPELSKEVQSDFRNLFVPILQIDPYSCQGLFPNHDLKWNLEGWKAMEIELEENGYSTCYRLIYKITDTKTVKRVDIVSFGLHDPAYNVANLRVAKNIR